MIVLSCPHCGDTERFGLRVDEHNRQSARAGNTVRTRPRQQRHQINAIKSIASLRTGALQCHTIANPLPFRVKLGQQATLDDGF